MGLYLLQKKNLIYKRYTNMERKRLIWADSLKGFLIMLVVLGHAIQGTFGPDCENNHLWNIIYSFHMPAFMVVSGFLAFRPHGMDGTSYWGVILRRCRQLIVPFVLWTIIMLLLKFDFSFATIGNYLLFPDKGLWFLWVLFFITWLFVSGGQLAQMLKAPKECVELCICLLLVAVMLIFEPRIFGFQFIAYYFLFYTFGYYLHKYQDKLMSNRWTLIISLALCWFFLAWYWNMHKLPEFLRSVPVSSTILQYLYRFVTAVIAIYVLFAVAQEFLENTNKWNKPLEHLGKVSLGIYAVHMMLIGNTVRAFKQYAMGGEFVIICSFAVGLIVSWGVVWVLNKNKFTAMLFLGKL